MIKTLIVSGGEVNSENLIEILNKNEFHNIIASDRGLEVLDKCNIKPNFIIGDFDSINREILNKYLNDKTINIKKLNPEKDYTDTHMALKLAMELESNEIIILGGIGTRIDHTIANMHILKEALEKNIECKIINQNNEIRLINKRTILKLDNKYKYISLIPLTTKVKGVTLKGFKYPLTMQALEIGHSIGVSNEQTEETAEISLEEGILILIKSRD